MIINATNETQSNIALPELNGYILVPSTAADLGQVFGGQLYKLAGSDTLTENIANGNITINDGTSDLGVTEALQYVVLQNVMQGPKDGFGRLQFKPSSRNYGTQTCWTGEGDDVSNINNVFGGTAGYIKHNIGDDTVQSIILDFNAIANESYLFEVICTWAGADGDKGDFISIPVVTTTESSSSTNYQKFSTGDPLTDSLIFPASGDGNLNVTADLTDPHAGLVQMIPDDDGVVPNGYWNAEYNSTTGLFENITAAPDGSGSFNLYHEEINLGDVGNRINFIGSGTQTIGSPDSKRMGQGFRVKMVLRTNTGIADHAWSACITMGLHRADIMRKIFS